MWQILIKLTHCPLLSHFFPQSNSDKTCSRQQIASEVSQFCPQPLHSAAFCALWNHIILLCTFYNHCLMRIVMKYNAVWQLAAKAQGWLSSWAMLALTDQKTILENKRMKNNKLSSKLFKSKIFVLYLLKGMFLR